MLRNYMTIMVVPQKNGKILRFELSSLFAKAFFVVSSLFIIFSAAITTHYAVIKEKSKRYDQTEKAIMLQKFKLQEIDNQLSSQHSRLSEFEEFDRKLRLISGLQESATRIRYITKNGNLPNMETTNERNNHDILTKLKKLEFDTKLREISFFQLSAYLQERKDRLARTPSIAPTKGYITSRFGKRSDPFTGKAKFHNGLDFANRPYTPIYAPADGLVINTYVNGNFGEFLVIYHGYNIVTRYGHLSKYEVKVGQKVKRGGSHRPYGEYGTQYRNTFAL